MRGYVEKDPVELAEAAILTAAKKYVAAYLDAPFTKATDKAERNLLDAALAYAETLTPPKKKSKKSNGNT